MLEVRNDKYKLLYDLEVSKKDRVEICELKEGEKPSIMSDTMFKAMLYNESRLKYSVKLISYYLDVEYDELLKNIKLSKTELDKDKEKSKGYRTDYVGIIDDTRINIEVNNNSDLNTMERNMDYAFKLYGSTVVRSKNKSSYKYNQVIQFNLNNFSFNGNDKVVDIYTISNKEYRLTNNIIFIQIYIPNLRRKWYNGGIHCLSEEEKYILGLIEPNILSSEELGKDIDIMKEYIKEVEEVVDEEYFGESYDKELAWKEECYNDGVKEGIQQGIQQGSLNKSIEIAKVMLKDNVSIDTIIKYTNLSKKEIDKL